MSLIERIVISLSPIIAKFVTSQLLSEQEIYIRLLGFFGIIYVLILLTLTYRCKIKTEKKPQINFKRSWVPLIPIMIWYVAVFVLSYAPPNPIIMIVLRLLSTSLALFLISFIFYYESLRGINSECFPEGMLQKIWNFIKGIF